MIFRFGKYALLSFVTAILGLSAFCEEPAQALLERARNPKGASTYGMFQGTLQHRKRGEETKEMPIFFGIVIQPAVTDGRILLPYRNESYTIHQIREAGASDTKVESDPETAETLSNLGVRVSDLTMSFLHYKLVATAGDTTLSGVVSCRVLWLESPDYRPEDKNLPQKEFVKVYIEKEHAFPLKAEFFRTMNDKKPFRLMEANGFTKKNDLYYARTILVEGPGWRTKVEFEPKLAVLGLYNGSIPSVKYLYPEKTEEKQK